MKNTMIGLLAALAAVSAAGTARAQICAGYPTTDRQFAFGANMQFPEGADFGQIWGVEASYNATGPLSFAGGVTFVNPEGDDNSEKGYGVGLALEFPSIDTRTGASISLCPIFSFNFANIEDLGTLWSVPTGFGLGTTLPAGSDVTISPYVVPQMIYAQFDPDDDLIGVEGESDIQYGIAGGAILGFGTFWLGGTVAHVFEEGVDPTFGIRAGIRL